MLGAALTSSVALVSTGLTSAGLTSATALGATLAVRTSLSIILPLGPVPTALAKSTPNFVARFFALGEANTLPSSLALATAFSTGALSVLTSALTSTAIG